MQGKLNLVVYTSENAHSWNPNSYLLYIILYRLDY